MQLAHQVGERGLAVDGAVVEQGLSTEADLGVGLVQLSSNLIYEVVLFGDSDRRRSCNTLVRFILLVESASHERTSKA